MQWLNATSSNLMPWLHLTGEQPPTACVSLHALSRRIPFHVPQDLFSSHSPAPCLARGTPGTSLAELLWPCPAATQDASRLTASPNSSLAAGQGWNSMAPVPPQIPVPRHQAAVPGALLK